MVPWQERKEKGLLKAFGSTVKQALFRPGEFFFTPDIVGSYRHPVYFYAVLYLVIAIATLILDPLYARLFKWESSMPSMPLYLYPLIVLIVPIIAVAGLFIIAGILHLFVLLCRGVGGYKGTLHVLAYSASANLLTVIPYIGGFIALCWGIVVGVIGFKRVHNLNTFRAVIAYCVFPFIAVLGIVAAIIIPNLSRARITSNEAIAKGALEMVSTAAENYALKNNGQYPKDEYDLKYEQENYPGQTFSNKKISGYIYNFDMSPTGYALAARPADCGITGNKAFSIKTKGQISEEECRK